jgi:hypothetical protein
MAINTNFFRRLNMIVNVLIPDSFSRAYIRRSRIRGKMFLYRDSGYRLSFGKRKRPRFIRAAFEC